MKIIASVVCMHGEPQWKTDKLYIGDYVCIIDALEKAVMLEV